MNMIDFGKFLLGGGILGASLKDLSLGIFSISTEYDTDNGPQQYKVWHLGLLLAEIRVLIPLINGK
jgi:hypothetical protein